MKDNMLQAVKDVKRFFNLSIATINQEEVMKLRIFLTIFAILAFCTGCSEVIFRDTFELDIVGAKPIDPPPEPPPGDSLNMVGLDPSILVIDSVPLISKAVEISKPQMPETVFECITTGGPYTSGRYEVTYRAYSKYVNPVPSLITAIESSTAKSAFELELTDGRYELESGDGLETLSIGYEANEPQAISITIDMDVKRFWLRIDGADVATKRQFLDPGFDNVHSLRFEYPEAMDPVPGSYVVDNILIKK